MTEVSQYERAKITFNYMVKLGRLDAGVVFRLCWYADCTADNGNCPKPPILTLEMFYLWTEEAGHPHAA